MFQPPQDRPRKHGWMLFGVYSVCRKYDGCFIGPSLQRMLPSLLVFSVSAMKHKLVGISPVECATEGAASKRTYGFPVRTNVYSQTWDNRSQIAENNIGIPDSSGGKAYKSGACP
jgi:hypothetical protein